MACDFLDPDNDLNWLAFRYVAGELDDAESAAFEQRLDADQRAREAVASAVGLVGAIHVARPTSFRLRTVAGWLSVAAAAAIAIALIPKGAPPKRKPSGGDLANAAVALAWPGIHAEVDRENPPLEILDMFPDNESPTPPEIADEPPAWLVEAASLPDRETRSEGQGS